MSLTDKFRGLMGRPDDDLAKDNVSIWMKYGARSLGTLAGGMAIFMGVWAATGIILGSVSCLIAGIWQMLAGFVVIVGEAPCCCIFLDFVSTASDKFEKMQYWHRAAIYVGIAIPPIFMCFSLSTIMGSGLIFCTGAFYGLMGLGKKAPAEVMQSSASGKPTSSTDTISNMSSSLVENAQSISKTPVAINLYKV